MYFNSGEGSLNVHNSRDWSAIDDGFQLFYHAAGSPD